MIRQELELLWEEGSRELGNLEHNAPHPIANAARENLGDYGEGESSGGEEAGEKREHFLDVFLQSSSVLALLGLVQLHGLCKL